MNNDQLILKIICLLPIINWISLKYLRNFKNFYNFAYNLFPILYLINLYNLTISFKKNYIYFSLIDSVRGVSIAFGVNKIDIFFLYFISIIWLILTFYLNRYFAVKRDKIDYNFKEIFVLGIGLVNLLILSKNLFSILFFFLSLLILNYIIIQSSNYEKNSKFSKIYIFFSYFQNFLLFLMLVIFFKFKIQIDFFEKVIIPNNYNEDKHNILLVIMILGLFLNFLTPFYLFIKNIEFESLIMMVIFLIFTIFSSSFIYFKVVNYLFGINAVKVLVSKFGIKWLEIIIFSNLIITSFLLFKNYNFKFKILILMINQFGVFLLSFIILSSINLGYLQNLLIGFILNFIVIFMCLSNYELLWLKSYKNDIISMFQLMPLTSSLLIFSLFSIVGIAPTISFTNYYNLFKNLYVNKFFFSFIFLVLNNIFVLFFVIKTCKIILFKSKKSILEQINYAIKDDKNIQTNNENKEDSINDLIDNNKIEKNDNDILLKIASKIDYNSRLILTILIIVILNFASLLLNNILII